MLFDLKSGRTKCVSEDIKSNSMTVGKYRVVNPNEGYPLPDSHKITVRVSSSNGNGHHVEEHVDSGHFAFVASDSGVHTTCFATPDHKPETVVTIEFDWKSGVAAKDWSKVAKKGRIENVLNYMSSGKNLPIVSQSTPTSSSGETERAPVKDAVLETMVMELELKKLYDTVTSIYDEIFYLREREEEMQNLNTSTNSKMAGLSFLSLLVCLSVAGLQLWHLKAYFGRKKLL